MKKIMVLKILIWRIKDYDVNFKIKDFFEKVKDIFIEVYFCFNNLDYD